MPDPVAITQVEKAIEAVLGEREAFPRPVARGIVVNPYRRILRGQPNDGSHWQYPGGGLDEGESSLDAAIRETREEGQVVTEGVAGIHPFPAIKSQRSADCLAFGAPRRYEPGGRMSKSADDLLRAAARRLGLDEQDYLRCRYDWFDRLGKRLSVPWQGVITYHVLALKEEKPFHRGRHPWDWQRREWFDIKQLEQEASPGGHTRQLLDEGLAKLVAQAAETSRRYEQERGG